MNKTFHFISGLPRSGSTLLAAILRQNPRFHAGMTSPVGSMVSTLLAEVSAGSQWGPVVTLDQRRRLLKGVFDSFYADQSDKDVIFDTNRAWCSRLPTLLDLFPDAKIIACVRHVGWVMDSLEKIYRANPYENTLLFSDANERSTVYSRVETLAQRNRLVGFAWAALREAYYSEHARSLLVVDYELLATMPEKVIPLIYQFIGEPLFEHDYENLVYDAPEFDEALGVRGLHHIRKQVKLERRQSVLPPDLFERYSDMAFWENPQGSKAHRIMRRSNEPTDDGPLTAGGTLTTSADANE